MERIFIGSYNICLADKDFRKLFTTFNGSFFWFNLGLAMLLINNFSKAKIKNNFPQKNFS